MRTAWQAGVVLTRAAAYFVAAADGDSTEEVRLRTRRV
jgi:hypothetical protein